MMYRALLAAALLAFGTSEAGTAREFTLQLTQEQWARIGNPARFEDDLVVLQSGEKVWGRLEEVPLLRYSFGSVQFNHEEIAGFSFADRSKMQIVTRNGQNFIGQMPEQPLQVAVLRVVDEQDEPPLNPEAPEYVSKRISVSDVNFILLKQRKKQPRLLNERFHSVILNNGDRFPVIMATAGIGLTDGWRDFQLDPQDIVDVRNRGGLEGFVEGEGLDVKLKFSFVRDKYLPVRLAKDGDSLKVPWSEIKQIKKDMGEFILTTPYLFAHDAPDGMAFVPPGRFVMGPDEPIVKMIQASPGNAARGALGGAYIHKQTAIARGRLPTKSAPSYVVEMPGFYIDKHEVTNVQYAAFVESTGHRPPRHWPNGRVPRGLETHPVVNVSLADAKAYARWAGKRLPTEIEWERAAKGATGDHFPYGSEFVESFSNVRGKKTRPVGSFAARIASSSSHPKSTAKDIFDMSGNVAEWTTTPFKDLDRKPPHPTRAYERARHAASAAMRVVRGGAFKHTEYTATTHHRTAMHENDFNSRTGFRCVSDEPPERR